MGHHDTEDQTASLTLTNCADKNLKLAEQATWSWKKNGGKSWKLWWYPIQVIKPPPWHWPIVLPGHLVSALWTWGGKQKIENGTHWYVRKDQIKWKTDYLGKCSSMTREKNIPKERDMFKERWEGLSNTLAGTASHAGSYFGLFIFW